MKPQVIEYELSITTKIPLTRLLVQPRRTQTLLCCDLATSTPDNLEVSYQRPDEEQEMMNIMR
jgi:hypothetical protein